MTEATPNMDLRTVLWEANVHWPSLTRGAFVSGFCFVSARRWPSGRPKSKAYVRGAGSASRTLISRARGLVGTCVRPI